MIKHFRKTLTMFLSFLSAGILTLPQSIFGALGPGQTLVQSGSFINFSSWALLTLKYTHKLKQTRPPVASGLKRIPPRSTGESLSLWERQAAAPGWETQALWFGTTSAPESGQAVENRVVGGRKEWKPEFEQIDYSHFRMVLKHILHMRWIIYLPVGSTLTERN